MAKRAWWAPKQASKAKPKARKKRAVKAVKVPPAPKPEPVAVKPKVIPVPVPARRLPAIDPKPKPAVKKAAPPPPPPPPKPKAPPYKPSKDDLTKAAERIAIGHDSEDVRKAMGLSRSVFTKHFGRMIADAGLLMRARLADIVWREADKGKQWAVDALTRAMNAHDADKSYRSDAGAADEAEQAAKTPRPVKLGKKEAQRLEAEETVRTISDEWGSDLAVTTH